MKKLLSLFRKKRTRVIVLNADSRVKMEITVNEWLKDVPVKVISVSYTRNLAALSNFGGNEYYYSVCILYKL